MEKRETRPGYVYVKAHKNAPGLHKIGLTRRPEQREQQLGGDDCQVVARVLVNDPEGLEEALHCVYDEVRVPQSEWFNLSSEQLDDVMQELVEAHEECLQHVVLPGHAQIVENMPQGFVGHDIGTAVAMAGVRPIEYIEGRGFFLRDR